MLPVQRGVLRRRGGPRAAATVGAAGLLLLLQACGAAPPPPGVTAARVPERPPVASPAAAPVSSPAAVGAAPVSSPAAVGAAPVAPTSRRPAREALVQLAAHLGRGVYSPVAGDPVAVRLPRLGIGAAVEPLHLGRSGELLPPRHGRAGWYARGPEPGELGRAVIAGHLDSRQGRDVFWNLRSARPGDRIVVDVAGGPAVRFVVQSVGRFARTEFPSRLVYGGLARLSELRLITCGGEYDRSRGGYQDNVVVFAVRA